MRDVAKRRKALFTAQQYMLTKPKTKVHKHAITNQYSSSPSRCKLPTEFKPGFSDLFCPLLETTSGNVQYHWKRSLALLLGRLLEKYSRLNSMWLLMGWSMFK